MVRAFLFYQPNTSHGPDFRQIVGILRVELRFLTRVKFGKAKILGVLGMLSNDLLPLLSRQICPICVEVLQSNQRRICCADIQSALGLYETIGIVFEQPCQKHPAIAPRPIFDDRNSVCIQDLPEEFDSSRPTSLEVGHQLRKL